MMRECGESMGDWLGLAGRPALVVGAGGLGGASAVSLAVHGAHVVVADKDEAALEAVARAAKDEGSEVVTVRADVSTPEASRALVAEASSLVGTPQVFLHAVGRNDRRPVLELEDDD